jgi:hypothetical protein
MTIRISTLEQFFGIRDRQHLAVFCLSRQAAIGQKLPFVMGSYPATSGVQIIH